MARAVSIGALNAVQQRLRLGVVDAFQAAGLAIFGPTEGAAQLEGSKAFTKDFLARHAIPSADYQTFSEVEPALAYLGQQGAPIVIKARMMRSCDWFSSGERTCRIIIAPASSIP